MRQRSLLLSASLLPVAVATEAKAHVVGFWKGPSCGCGNRWVEILERDGFVMKVFDTGSNAMRGGVGNLAAWGSHHTDRVGLAVPGKPIGSPGMDGPEYGECRDPYEALLVQADDSPAVFNRYPGRS